MTVPHAAPGAHGGGWASARVARVVAEGSLAVLAAGGALFAVAWGIGGDDAVSDNWVGATTMVALFAGMLGSAAALVAAVVAGLRGESWSRLWLPLVTFPAVLVAVGLLELLVFE